MLEALLLKLGLAPAARPAANPAASDDADLVRDSGLVMGQRYAARYLAAAPHDDPVRHYLATGEAQGARPNPFFDPGHFERQAGTRSLVAYLQDRRHWGCQVSNVFDGTFYLEQHFAQISTAENPLVHFWRRGIDLGLSPHPRLDMAFFRRAIARDHIDLREAAWDQLDPDAPDRPLNLPELAAAQAAFRAGIALDIVRPPPSARRRHLVFVQAGAGYRLPPLDAARSFDIHLNVYDASALALAEADCVTRQPGTKVTAIAKILATQPDLLTAYEAVLFLDDDVEIDAATIETLFRERAAGGFDLVQAALTADSDCFFAVLKQPLAGPGISLMSAVEIMMPLLSRRALEAVGWVFGETVSGWSSGFLLGREVRKTFGDTVALIGQAVAAHRRPTSAGNSYYRTLAAQNIIPTVEAGAVSIKHGLNDKVIAIRRL